MIVILAGAGASSAVSAEKYPTTRAFFERLSPRVREEALFKFAVDLVAQRKGARDVDVEELLWVLGEFEAVRASLDDRNTALGFLAPEQRIGEVLKRPLRGARPNQTLPQGAFRSWMEAWDGVREQCVDLKDRINRLVFDFYGMTPSSDELTSNWGALFSALTAHQSPVEIFTTNYDLVIEEALEQSNFPLQTGFPSRGATRSLDTTLWQPGRIRPADSRGLLTKLHGSVHWQRRGEEILSGSPVFVGDHARHPILYPGFKGEPKESPLSLFHGHFARCLQNARLFLVVGFAFRDALHFPNHSGQSLVQRGNRHR